jgi:hypothetical protein
MPVPLNKMSKQEFDKMDLDMKSNLKIMFSGSAVMWNLYDKPSEAYFNGTKITRKHLNRIVIPETFNNKILLVPIHRNSLYTKFI